MLVTRETDYALRILRALNDGKLRSIQEISERCKETMINDGSCGVRELISWVQSYMICGDMMEAARYTVLSSVSADEENRKAIETTCFEPILGF